MPKGLPGSHGSATLQRPGTQVRNQRVRDPLSQRRWPVLSSARLAFPSFSFCGFFLIGVSWLANVLYQKSGPRAEAALGI